MTTEMNREAVPEPSNPIGFDGSGNAFRTLPDGQSSGSIVAGLLPAGANYAKAFGTPSVVPKLTNIGLLPVPSGRVSGHVM